jgi:hypothetical protein
MPTWNHRVKGPEQQERRVAKKRGGVRQPGSGSGWLHTDDVLDTEYRCEMKQTEGKSISIKLEDWEVLRKSAIVSGRKPAMHIQIGKRRLVVLDEGDDRSPLA